MRRRSGSSTTRCRNRRVFGRRRPAQPSGVGAGRLIARDQFVVTPPATDAGAKDLIGSILPEILGVPRIEVAISMGRSSAEPRTGAADDAYQREGPGVRQDRMERPDQGARSERGPRPDWGMSPPRFFDVPRLIHEGEWNGSAITVLSPHPHRLFRKGGQQRASIRGHPAGGGVDSGEPSVCLWQAAHTCRARESVSRRLPRGVRRRSFGRRCRGSPPPMGSARSRSGAPTGTGLRGT